jgi:hypothetical protein
MKVKECNIVFRCPSCCSPTKLSPENGYFLETETSWGSTQTTRYSRKVLATCDRCNREMELELSIRTKAILVSERSMEIY